MLIRVLVTATAAAALFLNMAMAENYDVGAPGGGWDLNTPLQAWANNNKFVEGDTITFVYAQGESVLEVTLADYDSCTTNEPILSDSSGKTVISLNSIVSRYFTSGTPTHCDRGMKVVITTTAAAPSPLLGTTNTTTTPSSSPQAATAPSSPSPTKSPSSSTTPAGSPTASSIIAPVGTPKNSPKIPPSKAPARSPSKIPAPWSRATAHAPAAESPASAPSRSTTPHSSANKISLVNGITTGMGFIIIMLLKL